MLSGRDRPRTFRPFAAAQSGFAEFPATALVYKAAAQTPAAGERIRAIAALCAPPPPMRLETVDRFQATRREDSNFVFLLGLMV